MTDARAEPELLRDFLAKRDVSCPTCGYNLRGLRDSICPECRRELHLAVTTPPAPHGWFFLLIAPGIFSGVAAVALLVPIVVSTIESGTPPPAPVWWLQAIGLASGGLAIGLMVQRRRVVRPPWPLQAGAALLMWAAHVGLFFAVLGRALGWW